MSNNAMSNETDLDWLARNVHVWREGANYVCVNHTDGGHVFHEHNRNCAIWFTKDQWLARRAELQNKPSWSEIQDWVNWIAQSSTGLWFGSDREPEIDVVAGHSFVNPSSFRLGVTFGDGEVLGDWRDTLERRPERTRAEMEVELVKAAFQPFTSIEENQELGMSNNQDMKRDSGWFERGELPPVGVECIFEPGDGACYFNEYELKASGKSVKVIAHTRYKISSCDVAVFRWDLDECFGVSTGNAKAFSPIRTERDVLISVIVEEMNHYDTDGKLADAILAAGFSLRAK